MKDIISWWSGGITSAVTCKICIDLYGIDRVLIVFIDTKNEDPDTYRFMKDCEKWYGIKIETITGVGEGYKYNSIQDVWRRFNSLNVAHGAVCSSEIKREVRERWQKDKVYTHQAFGFDINESKRARSLLINHKKTKPIFPLLMHALAKTDCIKIIQEAGLEPPITYSLGFLNNNCFQTGCTQGGIGYWQKMAREWPEKYNAMAAMEHELTDAKGSPVTMLRDKGNRAKETGVFNVFLKPHPDYPGIKDLSKMKGREPKPLFECNGFCGTNDLERNPAEDDINFQTDLFNQTQK